MNNEVAKELAEQIRKLVKKTPFVPEVGGISIPLIPFEQLKELRAALAKFDAEQGKAAAMAWTEREIKLMRHAISLLSGYAHNAANHYAQKGPQSNLEYMKAAIEDARALDDIWVRLSQATAPVPAPSDVRAPAVVAAQGVTEEDAEAVLSAVFDQWDHPMMGMDLRALYLKNMIEALESFAATREQQGGEDARMLEWLLHNLPGKSLREIGVVPSSGGLEYGRAAIRAAIAAKEREGND